MNLFDIYLPTELWFELDDSVIKICNDFGAAINSVPMYLSRRNASVSRVKNQIIEGKLGEFAANQFLQNEFHFPNNVTPDIRVYSKGDKSWDADLLYNKADTEYPNVHVKCCTKQTAKRYGESYVFQCSNGLFRDVKSTDYICMVLYDPPKFCVRSLVSWSYLHKLNIFRLPKLDKHKGSKVCIYYEDLVCHTTPK